MIALKIIPQQKLDFQKGLNTNQGVSIVEVYKEYVKPTETESKCQQVHNFRDFLTGIQIHGYALGLSPFLKI